VRVPYNVTSKSCYSQLQENLKKKNRILQANSRNLNESDAVDSYLNTTIDGLTKTVEALNQTVRWLCGQIKEVITFKVEALSVPSLKYLTQSGTSNFGPTSAFRLNVLLPSSGSYIENGVICIY